MNILIFYASYGGGHLSAAKALKQYINDNYPDINVNMVDCVKYINPAIEKVTTDYYKKFAKKAPWAWGEIYKLLGKNSIVKLTEFSSKFMSKKILNMFEGFNPDIVISTHPLGGQMTASLKAQGKIDCVLATIMTDFASHDQWLIGHEYMDYIFVSNANMKQSIVNKGIPANKIRVTGIPLSNRFLIRFNKNEIKESFNLDPHKKLILFFGGGEFGLGESQTNKILDALINNISDKYQVIAIAGKNKKMEDNFRRIVKENNVYDNVFVYGYTNQVPELMNISDLVITKPGGLTSSESLASGLPIIAINPIPGQEVENAEFLVKSGVAIWLKKNDNFYAKLKEILNDEQTLKQMKLKAKIIAKKNSTENICKILINENYVD